MKATRNWLRWLMIPMTLTLVLALPATSADPARSAWSNALYHKHTYKTFAKFRPAHKRLKFTRIDYPLLHAAVFYETNRRRVQEGKKPFRHSPALEKAAWGHSRDMSKLHFFSHDSPVRGKESPFKRMAQEGVKTGYRAENIAYTFGIEYKAGRGVFGPKQNGGYFSYKHRGKPIKNHTYLGVAREVVQWWMTSPGHRANILNSRLSYLGAGASHFKDSEGLLMDMINFTQNFASARGPG